MFESCRLHIWCFHLVNYSFLITGSLKLFKFWCFHPAEYRVFSCADSSSNVSIPQTVWFSQNWILQNWDLMMLSGGLCLFLMIKSSRHQFWCFHPVDCTGFSWLNPADFSPAVFSCLNPPDTTCMVFYLTL